MALQYLTHVKTLKTTLYELIVILASVRDTTP